jgi:hypothetical protein
MRGVLAKNPHAGRPRLENPRSCLLTALVRRAAPQLELPKSPCWRPLP